MGRFRLAALTFTTSALEDLIIPVVQIVLEVLSDSPSPLKQCAADHFMTVRCVPVGLIIVLPFATLASRASALPSHALFVDQPS
jgi:hypothetical protein